MREIQTTKNLHVLAIMLAGLGMLCTVVVVGFAVGLPSYNNARDASMARLDEELGFRTRILEEFLASSASAAAHLSARSDGLRVALPAATGPGDPSSAADHHELQSPIEMVEKTGVLGLARVDEGGGVRFTIGDTLDPGRLTTLATQTEGRRIIAPLRLAGRRVFVVQQPVFGVHGGVVARDLLVFPLESLAHSIHGGRATEARERLVIATRNEGRLVPIYKPPEMPHLEQSGALTEALRLGLEGAKGTIEGAIGERAVVVAYQALDGAPWTAAMVVDRGQLFAGAHRQVTNMSVVAFLLLLGGGGITLMLMRRVGRQMVIQAERLGALAQEHGILLENSGDVVYRQDMNQRFTFISPAIHAVTGYSVAEWLTGFPGYHTDDPRNDRARYLTAHTLATGEDPPPYEVEVRHKAGGRVTLEVKERALTEDGKVVGIIGVARDITARRQAEEALAKSATEWSHAMEFVEEGVCLLDNGGRVVRANRAFLDLFRVTADEVMGEVFQDAVCPAGAANQCPVAHALAAHDDGRMVLEPDHPNNPTGRALDISLRFVRGDQGEPEGLVLAIRDLTRLRDTEGELRLAASVFDNSLDGVVIADARRRIIKVNPAFTEITGCGHDEVLQASPVALFSGDLGPDRYREVWSRLRYEGSWRGELPLRCKDGSDIAAWWSISALSDQAGRPYRYIATVVDITAQKASEERIHHLANYDAVTGLPNRMLLQDRLDHAMERSRRDGGRVGVLFLDLDHFKNVNDSLGHAAGDAMLRQVSERIRAQVREQDTVARLGGDEFTVVLEGLKDGDEAGVVAKKILGALNQPYVVAGHEVFASASIGIAMFPADGGDGRALLKNADTAMYQSKAQGRNAFCYYTAEMTACARERLGLEVALRHAVTNREFALFYQPQVDSRSGEVVGAEALLRWQHGDLGMVSPDRFIPLAEDSRLIKPIGEWVFETACLQLKAWQDSGRAPRRMAVNLSARQLEDRGFVDFVFNVIERTGLRPDHLEIEITESILMENRARVVGLLEELSNAGILIAVDDFGTGYSSLGYLKRFPIDRIKIDRSFVCDIPRDRDDVAIATAIIAMSHSLGLEVIAEGVETREQLEFLRRTGCREVQGYYCSRPLAGDDFEAFLATRFTSLRPKLGLAV